MKSDKECVSPYYALFGAVKYISKQANGKAASISYTDIQIRSDPHTFLQVYAITIQSAPWLIGVLAPNFAEKNNLSYAIGFPHDWQNSFLRPKRTGILPRITAEDFLLVRNNIMRGVSINNAYIGTNNGNIDVVNEGKRSFVPRKKLSEIVSEYKIESEGKISYRFEISQELGKLLYNVFNTAQAHFAEHRQADR